MVGDTGRGVAGANTTIATTAILSCATRFMNAVVQQDSRWSQVNAVNLYQNKPQVKLRLPHSHTELANKDES